MNKTLSSYLLAHRIGEPSSYRNLEMVPLFTPEPVAPERDYLLFDEAATENLAYVTEISNSGSVPELRVVNDSDLPVLLLDGEELVGAKQNRVLNLTVLVAAHSKTSIPVSCVEAGRWHQESAAFTAAPHAQPPTSRAARCADVSSSLMSDGSRRSDQQSVWRDISLRCMRMGSAPPTGAMNQIFQDYDSDLSAFAAALTPREGQCGACFRLKSRILSLDLFDHPATLARVLPKLVRSAALDALDPGLQGDVAGDSPDQFMKRLAASPVNHEPAVALGEDFRFAGAVSTGGALAWQGRFVHIYAFPRNGSADYGTRVSRPSSRARGSERP